MLTISIANLKPNAPRLTGAAIGEAHGTAIARLISEASFGDGDIVILDFLGIESATASYLKRVLGVFFSEAGDNQEIKRGPVPILLNAGAPDLCEDLEDYLEGKGRVLIVAQPQKKGLHFERMMGNLDRAAAETYGELCRSKEITAQQLFERFPGRTNNQTAWNNRLVQLLDLRIARRRREGRLWIYQPTVAH